MEQELLDNWHAAGLIVGSGYADEMGKLATITVIDAMLEDPEIDKTALMAGIKGIAKSLFSSPVTKMVGIGTLSAAGGGAAASVYERGKAKKEIAELAPKIFRQGFIQGARRGYMQGARRGFAAGKTRRA